MGECINVFSLVESYTNKCRFCYSYKPPGPSSIDNFCVKPVCATNEHIALVSSLQMVTFNSTKTSERSLLLFNQRQYLQETAAAQTNQVIQDTKQNSSTIAGDLYGQLLQLRGIRYEPYQPYIYPTMPQHVADFQMSTINVGVPHSFFTIADCKGVQSVTT
jgi:hypothetical protein